jgi:murein DD-endopeptidase MepM/ murein hydrolase activator NlpD
MAAMVGFLAVFAFAAPAQAQNTNPFGSNAPAADSQELRALFASWRQTEMQNAGVMAIPSLKPVANYTLTSSFGSRSDPFRGSRRMHNGLDMAGPIGTPIYATADGIVGRAEWFGGYGRYVEVNHGGGMQTRYGHMSEILVQSGARVTRGQMIGRMGSTGRSTGSHLHYEVRIDGRPVNPVPFLSSGEYLASLPVNSTLGEGATAAGASQ